MEALRLPLKDDGPKARKLFKLIGDPPRLIASEVPEAYRVQVARYDDWRNSRRI